MLSRVQAIKQKIDKNLKNMCIKHNLSKRQPTECEKIFANCISAMVQRYRIFGEFLKLNIKNQTLKKMGNERIDISSNKMYKNGP